MYGTVAVLALIVFCYSMIADRLDRTVFGGAIAFTAIGLALGTSGLGVLQLSLNIDALGLLAELTLALLLFIDAANADLRELVRSAKLPRRRCCSDGSGSTTGGAPSVGGGVMYSPVAVLALEPYQT